MLVRGGLFLLLLTYHAVSATHAPSPDDMISATHAPSPSSGMTNVSLEVDRGDENLKEVCVCFLFSCCFV